MVGCCHCSKMMTVGYQFLQMNVLVHQKSPTLYIFAISMGYLQSGWLAISVSTTIPQDSVRIWPTRINCTLISFDIVLGCHCHLMVIFFERKFDINQAYLRFVCARIDWFLLQYNFSKYIISQDVSKCSIKNILLYLFEPTYLPIWRL